MALWVAACQSAPGDGAPTDAAGHAGDTGAGGADTAGAGGAGGAGSTMGNAGAGGATGSGAAPGVGGGGAGGAAEGGRGGAAGRGGGGGAGGIAGAGARGGGSAGSAGSTGGAGTGTGGTSRGGAAGTGVDLPGLYVSPAGSDANAGTMSAPFLTVTKARDVVRTMSASMAQDIHVYLRGGTYNIATPITFGVQDSGTNGHRIFYQAYPGETPVLNGATKVTGWTLSSGNIYKAPLSRTTKLRNLYVNDARAVMASKTVTSRGGTGTYAVKSGQASWAWASGSGSDGAKYNTTDVPAIASNRDDLEIVNGTTWNENIVCVRDVVTTSDGYRGLLFQQPYGAIAQLPGWNAGFSVTGTHKIYNAIEFLNGAGQFFFDKTSGTLYYYPRSGEDMATADVQAPVAETADRHRGNVDHQQGQEPDLPGHHLSEHGLQPLHGRGLARKGDGAGRERVHRVRRRQLAQQQVRDHGHAARHDQCQQRRFDPPRRQRAEAQRQRGPLDGQRRRQLQRRRELHR